MVFTTYMLPVAKARARVCMVNGYARAFTPTKTVNAESAIRAAFLQSGAGKYPAGVPLSLVISIYRPRPRSLPKRFLWPVTRPDLDNYLKLVLDALNGFAWEDDAQVVMLRGVKRFGEPPRIEIEIDDHTIDGTGI